MRALLRALPDIARTVARLAADPILPTAAKVALAAAVVYLVSPIDLIPDFIPVLGALDDVLVAAIVVDGLLNWVDRGLVLKYWPGSADSLERVARAAQRFAAGVFTAGHVVWSDDVQNDPRFAFPLFRVFPHRSGLIIPLAVDGAVTGAFYLVWWQERRDFPEGRVIVLETIGQLVGTLLKNAALGRVAEARRRAAEVAEERYRLLFDRNLAGVLWNHGDGRIIDCNESLARLLGYDSREEVLGHNVRDFYVDPSDREKVLAGIEPGGTVDGRELRWRRRDGTLVWLRVNLRVTAEGWFEGILIDTSGEKRVAQAEREAAELRAVAMLAAATAHEINNPLAIVLR